MRSCRLLLAACAIMLLLTGCIRLGSQAEHAQLLEGFEDDPLWSLDSANDYAALSTVVQHATEGAYALRIDVHDDGRDKAVVRKEVDLDLSQASGLLIDAFNPTTQAIGLALALHCADGSLFELRSQALDAGWNRNLGWDLDGGGFVDGTDLRAWAAKAGTVDRLLIYVRPVKGDCAVVVDRLRAAGLAILRRDHARVVAVAPPSGPLHRFAPAEIGVTVAFPPSAQLAANAVDPWLGRMTAVQARVALPDGGQLMVKGFCTGIDADAQGLYHYGLRLPTPLSGVERYQIGIGAGGSWTWSAPGALVVDSQAAGRGAVRRDPEHPSWLCRADGSWFYPLGENVAWSGDYEPYAAQIAAAGGNCLRVWICPWNNPLDSGGHLTAINFDSAARIDAIFAACARHGLVVQLCLDYHAALGWDWARNPWNAANGGPCQVPHEFWTNDLAREHFCRLLDYCVARWGASPQLMAWELFNEADLTPRLGDDQVVAWHRQMAGYLRRIDPCQHLITSSVSSPPALPGLWRDADLDLVEVHTYGQDPARQVADIARLFAPQALPVLIGEWGRGTQPADDQPDHGGVALRQALWCGWTAGIAGAPLPWWWDTHIAPDHLLSEIAHFAAFIRDEDPRGQDLHPIVVQLAPGASAHCLIGPDRAYGYVCDPGAVGLPGAAVLAAPLAGRQLALAGLPAGSWRLELWDTRSGTVIQTSTIAVADQTAVIAAPATAEFAFKLVRETPLQPGIRLR